MEDESDLAVQDSTAFQGDTTRLRREEWLKDAAETIATHGPTFLFTGKPDMLFARFEKFVERVYANSPSTLTNIQATNLYARLLSNEPPAPGREAPRTWFMACLSDPASCA